ncbi:MAG: hypothetical protein KA319_07555 [Ferruginibacter sp.]|nr:hypothetical protein [Ferruginibacter sp.]
MKTQIITLVLAVFFLASCSNAVKKEETQIVEENVAIDSVVKKYSKGVVSLVNATEFKEILCQNWVQEDDAVTLQDVDESTALLLSIRSFDFFNDGTFVKNYRTAWSYGTWQINDASKIITLKYENKEDKHTEDNYKVTALATDELNVINKGLNTSTILRFVATESKLKDIADEPFHIANNQWRIKPKLMETDEEIKKRLKANLEFFVLFYKWAIVKNDKHISFYGLPTCFKWYGGGIYMQKQEDLNDNWINCFYNKQQALKAYVLMEKVMGKKYTWPKENIGWVKKNLFVLEQMVKNLDAVN